MLEVRLLSFIFVVLFHYLSVPYDFHEMYCQHCWDACKKTFTDGIPAHTNRGSSVRSIKITSNVLNNKTKKAHGVVYFSNYCLWVSSSLDVIIIRRINSTKQQILSLWHNSTKYTYKTFASDKFSRLFPKCSKNALVRKCPPPPISFSTGLCW